MKKLIVTGATALATLFVVLGLAPSASAYPELTCNLTVDVQVLYEGESFTATGNAEEMEVSPRASATGDDIAWTMTFDDDTRTGHGAVFTQKFTTPDVDKTTVIPLVAKATNAAGTCTHTVNITVMPNGTIVTPPKNPHHLPNTGGPRLIILILGLGLVGAGAVAIRQSRRRHATGRHA